MYLAGSAGNGRRKLNADAVKRACAFLLAFLLSTFVFPDIAPAYAGSDGMLRVKLTRLGTPSSITMQADCGYVLSGDMPMNIPSGARFSVSASGGSLIFSCDGVSVVAPSGTKLLRTGGGTSGIRFISPSLSNVFCGDLILHASGSAITAVLEIYLETYLYGVVPYEMSNSFPLEALKVQAIAARNYAVKKMGGSKTYHLTDNTSDQVFKGYNAGYALAHQAVNETRGMLLYSGSSIASCYYTASNGGQTEATKNAWGGNLSYSVVKDDPYDLENPSSKKKTANISKDGSGLNASLKDALVDGMADEISALGGDASSMEITKIISITPMNPRYASPSRLYQTLRFRVSARAKGASGYVSAEGSVDVPTYGGIESWYGLSINSSKNETVWVDETAGSFAITFRRYGHGIGMSQRGAQTMAGSHGMGYKEILNFYYPGTSIKTASFSQAGSHGASTLPGGAIATAVTSVNAAMYRAANGANAGEIASGRTVHVYAVDGAWAKIGINGVCAWIKTENIRDFTLVNDPLKMILMPEEIVLAEDTPMMELPVETARQVQVVSAGSMVTVYLKNANWLWVMQPDGSSGYISAAAASATPEPSVTPEASVTPEPTVSAEPTVTIEVTATPEPTATPEVTASPAPTVTPAPTQQIPGDEPVITAEPTHAVPSDEPAATATIQPVNTPAAATATPKPTATATPNPNRLPMQPIPVDATIEPPPAPEGAEQMMVATGSIYVYINVQSGSTLTVRSRPDASSQPIGYLRRGTKVKLLAFDDEWACIENDKGDRGFSAVRYLQKEYIQIDTTPKPEASQPGNTSDDKPEWMKSFERIDTNVVFCNRQAMAKTPAPLHRSASDSSSVMGIIPAGMQFSVQAYNNEWAYVSRSGISGFVRIQYISLVS